MSTMKEMAVEYRRESARIAMRLREKKASGAPGWEIELLEKMLREMRVKQRVLDSYYEAPRESCITMSCAYTPNRSRGDDG